MKLTSFLLLAACLQVSAKARSQTVSFSGRKVPLEQVFTSVEKQTGYVFFYDEAVMSGVRPVTVRATNMPLETFLNLALKEAPLKFSFQNKTIVISRRPPVMTPVRPARDTTLLPALKRTKDTATIADIDSTKGSSLEGVVVLGFGQTQKKIAQTGAVVSIGTKEIKQSPVSNIANALTGRLPGLVSIQRSGEPGADDPQLYIRGISTTNSTAPLITIDGVQKESSAISMLDPNEVESVTILKDASATALYGVKGANGVIIIKTRRGKEGKPAASASLQTSVQKATSLPQYLDSYHFAVLANEAYKNDNPNGTLPPYTDADIEAYRTGSDPYGHPNVDWLNAMLQPARMTRADFNISGGSPMVKYFANIGYTDQQGLYKAEKNPQYDPSLNYKRYNFRSNIDIDFDKDFSLGLSLFGSIENKRASNTSTTDLFDYLMKEPPNAFPIKYPTGFYGGTNRSNPFQLLNGTGYTQSFNSSLSGMLTLTRKLDFITKGLFLKGNYSFDGYFTNNFTRTMSSRTAMYKGSGPFTDTASYVYAGVDQPLSAPSSSFGQNRDIWIDASLNYEQVFGDHTVTGLLLANRTQQVIGGQIPFVSQGLVSRLTYSFRNKYFAELNAGYNGTDNFAKGKRYGLFPAVSAGWVLSKENFLKDDPVIDFLKLRASYGITGNDQLNGRRWLFVSDYQSGTGYPYGDPLTSVGGVAEGPAANPDITWEKAHKLNIGAEIKILKELFGVTIDVFRERRSDILITRGSVPSIIGVPTANLPPANMGVVVNKGFEVEITHRQRIGNVTYFVKANGSYARNKILFMDEVDWPYDYLRRTGRPIGQLYGYTALGFFKDQDDIDKSPAQFGKLIPGDLKYKDLNHDNVIDANDQGPIGRTYIPEILFGVSGGVNWKNVDASFLFQGATNYNVIFDHEGAWEFYNGAKVMVQHLGRWTPATANTATYPVLHYGQNANNHLTGSFWMKDASYIRLKNVEVGYTFRNLQLSKSTHLSTLRIFVSGENLVTWDRMGKQSFDPEAPAGKGFYYPQLKVYNVGISTDF
ncbi:MAG TPA: TonB-dependent receptor [Puia sp.]|nr:TonB-dependent receptor [Puia sp.]